MAEHQEQVAQTVDQVYAAALVEMAEAAGELDAIGQEVAELHKLIAAEPKLSEMLASRVLGEGERAASIERIFKGNVSDLLYRFIQVVNAKDRAGMLSEILGAFNKIVDQRHGIVEAEAWVAVGLDQQQVDSMGSKLSDAIGRNVVLRQHVNPDLIGGMKLRIGDQMIDASVVTQLKLMKEKIIAEGRDKARQNLASIIEG